MQARQTKYIFVTGGVLSSLGKGLASASIGALMEARGLHVTFLKLDPYAAEIRNLKKELARVHRERELLKKSIAFFVKESG